MLFTRSISGQVPTEDCGLVTVRKGQHWPAKDPVVQAHAVVVLDGLAVRDGLQRGAGRLRRRIPDAPVADRDAGAR